MRQDASTANRSCMNTLKNHSLDGNGSASFPPNKEHSNRGMMRLVQAVQDLSMARDIDSIAEVVRHAAREMTGADGAAFVLRDGNLCYYADEDAIAPLWKGQRFPMEICISGWSMLNGKPAVIEDIYADPRIPVEAYRPTFVKSLAMIPIRPQAALGAIGNYWAQQQLPTTEQIELLQALANTTAVAMENVQVHNELESRVKARTTELEQANKELEAFSHTVSHDLRSPLTTITWSAGVLKADHCGQMPPDAVELINIIENRAKHMGGLIEGLLQLSRYSLQPLSKMKLNLFVLVNETLADLRRENAGRDIEVQVSPLPDCVGDAVLLRQVVVNLLSNAFKYTRQAEKAAIKIGCREENGEQVYFVQDNGVGFEMKYAKRLFGAFERLHAEAQFAGAGIGLSIVHRIITRHGGRIWAEAEVDRGATFYFTLPK